MACVRKERAAGQELSCPIRSEKGVMHRIVHEKRAEMGKLF